MSNLTPVLSGNDARWRRLRRDIACLAIDLAVLAIAYVFAFLVRFDASMPQPMVVVMAKTVLVAVLLQYAALFAFGVPSFSWVFISLRDVPPILRALGIATVAMLALRYGGEAAGGAIAKSVIARIPSSVIVLDLAFSALGIAGVRGLRRLQREWTHSRQGGNTLSGAPTVVIGAGVAGRMLLQELAESRALGFRPVAIVDDDRAQHGRVVCGLRVEGSTDEVTEVAARHGARSVLIAIASPPRTMVQRVFAQCAAAGLHIKLVPTLRELVTGKTPISQLRDVAIEDLLGREPVEIEASVAPAVIGGSVVLVTGAGGSIGSELCRQILRLAPTKLVLVERFENSLYEIHRELLQAPNGDRVAPMIADVTDEARMAEVFATHRPQVVFHAAAHKHVPMMELAPREAIKNNVFGTKCVADLADRFGVARFVLVSTDKAVRPSSVMGATKRLAELYVKEVDARSETRFASVRFGNVMGSAGSVIPLFAEQIARGGPVTVTHPEMERFFMTIPEAARLVLEAAGLAEGGETMLLDMGSPVRIAALAENMIRLSGLEPHRDVNIVFTGIRPGEKLHEELALPEEVLDGTACKKLSVWRGGAPTVPMQVALHRLRDPGRTADEVRRTLGELLPEYAAQQTAPICEELRAVAGRLVSSRMVASS